MNKSYQVLTNTMDKQIHGNYRAFPTSMV